jgi:hypothetical protein
MAAFTFKLELADGTPTDPPTLKAAVPDWQAGNTITLGPGRTLRVVRRGLRRDQTATRFLCSWSKRPGLKSH